MKQKSRKSGGARKIGRNKDKCNHYRLEGRREKNKKRKQEKHRKRMEKKREKKERR